ncbi:unnamed protein product [Adineta ricciae]|uniref:MPN domain-containing protein n=1 Tax=Adineta ricciae TaxID=249248 RepID=A0A813ZDC6_ADIRI|nr:unnamed protein product [Adineta ricciae]
MSESSIKSARERVQWLLENQCRIPIRSTTPISFYYKTSDNLIEEADHFYKTNQFEQSFILYSRYITLFVEELKQHHPDFLNVSVNDRERVKEIIRTKAFPRAEELKSKLIDKYAQDYGDQQKSTNEHGEDKVKISAPGLGHAPTNTHHEQVRANYVQIPAVETMENHLVQTNQESIKPTYDRWQKPITNSLSNGMGSFRRMTVPNDITTKFLQVAQRNTDRSIETCGILAGYRKDNQQYVITHIVVPKQSGGPDSCNTEKEEEMVEYISTHNLITLGWIHTHPTQTAFLSSVDLHTHLPYQMLIEEAIAIVISPKFHETAIFSLTSNTGIPIISTCRKTGFHEHANNPPLYVISSHTTYDIGLQCKIVDLRA